MSRNWRRNLSDLVHRINHSLKFDVDSISTRYIISHQDSGGAMYLVAPLTVPYALTFRSPMLYTSTVCGKTAWHRGAKPAYGQRTCGAYYMRDKRLCSSLRLCAYAVRFPPFRHIPRSIIPFTPPPHPFARRGNLSLFSPPLVSRTVWPNG